MAAGIRPSSPISLAVGYEQPRISSWMVCRRTTPSSVMSAQRRCQHIEVLVNASTFKALKPIAEEVSGLPALAAVFTRKYKATNSLLLGFDRAEYCYLPAPVLAQCCRRIGNAKTSALGSTQPTPALAHHASLCRCTEMSLPG